MTPGAPGPDPAPEPLFTTGPSCARAAVRRHRRAARSRVGVVLAAIALAVAVVAAGGAVTASQLSVDERHREFVVAGRMGQPVTARTIEVTVLGVRAAAVLGDPTDRLLHDTNGVWVLVRVRAEALDEPAAIGYAAVRDTRGRTYLASGRVDQPLADNGYRLQPGIPVEGEIAFEVPRDVATDLTVRLAHPSFDLRMGSVAEIPVPLDEQQVADGLAAPEPVRLSSDVDVVVAEPLPAGTWRSGR